MRYNDHRTANRLTQFVTVFDKICQAAGIPSKEKPAYHSDMTTNSKIVSPGMYFAEVLATVVGSSVMPSETLLDGNLIITRSRREHRRQSIKRRCNRKGLNA